MNKILVFWIWSVMCVGYGQTQKEDYILKEKDLIPEGTAYNAEADVIYIGSVYKQKVIGIDSVGREYNVIESKGFGVLSPIGMEYVEDTQTLWVCGALAPIVNKSGRSEWVTTILSFDMKYGSLKKKYEDLGYQTPTFLNDLTVTPEGVVYATESVNGGIFKIDVTTDTLEKWVNLDGYTFPNGIVYDVLSNNLFVAVDQGIIKIDPTTRKVRLLEAQDDIKAGGIDGLSIYEDYFIGHQSTKVSKFFFNSQKTRLTSVEILDSGDEFDSSTTGEIGNGYYHYIVNSQIRSGVNQKEKRIKPLDSLEPVIIRKLKL
ncbi:hypothetical protein [Flagellimonas meridianipacifica]|uniref:SMP-30/gluconolaconase/LRE-like protein n=1 Tax=Flagellimonas meridianipacifica TaxID=1080225 RepID=A0A2T0MI83_9FLAO|nr:hypothetical protein [Allomuricauda pacifica]PRX57290.1 hypothetical protein CLV81_1293 [Allomuricauda pacifica]